MDLFRKIIYSIITFFIESLIFKYFVLLTIYCFVGLKQFLNFCVVKHYILSVILLIPFIATVVFIAEISTLIIAWIISLIRKFFNFEFYDKKSLNMIDYTIVLVNGVIFSVNYWGFIYDLSNGFSILFILKSLFFYSLAYIYIKNIQIKIFKLNN